MSLRYPAPRWSWQPRQWGVSHSVGGVCPFGVKEGVAVYLDESLKRFDVVYPACGSASSAVKLTIPELETASGYLGWIDVCKGWGEDSI